MMTLIMSQKRNGIKYSQGIVPPSINTVIIIIIITININRGGF